MTELQLLNGKRYLIKEHASTIDIAIRDSKDLWIRLTLIIYDSVEDEEGEEELARFMINTIACYY